MNQLIDKLIEQCTTQNFSDCTGAFETFDKEKFAELIVRECAEYAEHNLDMAGYKKKFMLKHFGV